LSFAKWYEEEKEEELPRRVEEGLFMGGLGEFGVNAGVGLNRSLLASMVLLIVLGIIFFVG